MPAGYGSFKCRIVSLRTVCWEFIPLRSLFCNEAHAAFRQSCIVHQPRSKEVVVYCDARETLRQICYLEGAPVEHPPAGRSEANAKVEWKIGVALACLFAGQKPLIRHARSRLRAVWATRCGGGRVFSRSFSVLATAGPTMAEFGSQTQSLTYRGSVHVLADLLDYR